MPTLAVVLSLCFIVAAPAFGVSRSFTEAVSSDWLNADNWSPAGVPTAADALTIAAGKTATLGVAATIQSLTLAGTLQGNGSLTITGPTTWTGGTMAGSGTIHCNGGLQISGNAAKRLEWTLTNGGVATWSDLGSIAVAGGFNNPPGSSLTISNNRPMTALSPGARFDNAGTLVKTTVGQRTLISIPFHNTGVVSVVSGVLTLEAGGVHSGRFDIDGGTLELGGGEHLLPASPINGGAVLFSAGSVQIGGRYQASSTTISGGSVAFTGGIAATGPLTISNGTVAFDNVEGVVNIPTMTFTAGTITGASDLNISGLLTWNGGTMAGSGITHARGGLALQGTTSKRLDRTLNHSGAGTWVGNANLGMSGTFNNLVGATFEIQNDRGFAGSGDSARINNAGTLRKTGVGTTTTSAVILENSGVLEVASGTLSINPTFTQTAGVTRLLAGTTLHSSNPVLLSAGRLEGAGTVTAPVVNNAEIAPGLTVGTLSAAAFDQGAGGSLSIELAGTALGQHDQLSIGGDALLGGTLNVALVNGFQPQPGDRFTVLTFASAVGDFAIANGLRLGGGRGFDKIVETTGIVLRYGEENCSDGIDNDQSSLSDCADPKCLGVGPCSATPTTTASPSPTSTITPCTVAACLGDCDCDTLVSIAEILNGIELALGSIDATACASLDGDRSGAAEIYEIVAAVNNGSQGCGATA